MDEMTMREALQRFETLLASGFEQAGQRFRALEGSLGGIDNRLHGVDAGLERIDTRLEGLDTRLGVVDTRLEGLDTRLGVVDTRLEGVDTRLGVVDTRLEGLDTRLGVVDTRLEAVDGRLDGVEGRLEGIDGRLDGHDDKFDQLHRHFDVVAESLLADVRLVAEGVQSVDQKVDRVERELSQRIRESNADLRALIGTSYRGLDRRVTRLETR